MLERWDWLPLMKAVGSWAGTGGLGSSGKDIAVCSDWRRLGTAASAELRRSSRLARARAQDWRAKSGPCMPWGLGVCATLNAAIAAVTERGSGNDGEAASTLLANGLDGLSMDGRGEAGGLPLLAGKLEAFADRTAALSFSALDIRLARAALAAACGAKACPSGALTSCSSRARASRWVLACTQAPPETAGSASLMGQPFTVLAVPAAAAAAGNACEGCAGALLSAALPLQEPPAGVLSPARSAWYCEPSSGLSKLGGLQVGDWSWLLKACLSAPQTCMLACGAHSMQ